MAFARACSGFVVAGITTSTRGSESAHFSSACAHVRPPNGSSGASSSADGGWRISEPSPSGRITITATPSSSASGSSRSSHSRSRGFSGTYLGLDFVPPFIDHDISKYRNDRRARFQLFDIATEDFPRGYDYLFLSGVFNNRTDTNKQFMLDTIIKMFDACNKGVAFNAMSTYVDYYDDALYYSDPLDTFDFCKKTLTRKVTLRHDYIVRDNSIPFEYTIYLYR